jgi:hypothetical protein
VIRERGNKEMAGPGGVLKRTVWWPGGQVGTGSAVSDASCVL